MRIKDVFFAGRSIFAATTPAPAVPSGGTVSGRVTYEGTPTKQKPIDMSKEPSCAKQYATPPTTETVVTGANNSLVNVVVYVSAGASEEAAPGQAAVLTQKGCRYIPHVLALQVNQELKVLNEDEASHNIHSLAKINREWNKSQPPETPPIVEVYDKMEFIPVKCNVQPWMYGTFAVLKNSHYSISAEGGGFKLLTISGSETKTVNFVFKAKPY